MVKSVVKYKLGDNTSKIPIPWQWFKMHTLISVSSSQLSEKYGNIFSIRRGLTNIVYVSGYNAVKEALVLDSFARCVTPLFDDIYKGRGKAMCTMCAVVLFRLNSIQWKENKALSDLFFSVSRNTGKRSVIYQWLLMEKAPTIFC